MILTEAYDYMDLLLDKADQPYFTTEEKDKFLNLAVSDFINFQYQKMGADEEARRALSGCVDWNSFSLSNDEILSGNFLYDGKFPALSEKYTPIGTNDGAGNYSGTHSITKSDTRGFWKYGNHYVLPKQHLYVLAIAISYYNFDDIIDPSSGLPYAGVTSDDIVLTGAISVKNVSTRDYYENERTDDPFNKPNKENGPLWQYIENRIVFAGKDEIKSTKIQYVNLQTITLPTIHQAFSASTVYNSTAPLSLTFAEHYQKQIVQLAVEKMTRVDVGLMTPTS